MSSGNQAGKKPTAKSFTSGAVQRAVLSEAVQHPATIIPFALMLAAVMWSFAFKWTQTTLFWSVAFGFMSAASWIVNFFFRGETFAARYIEKLRRKRTEHEQLEARGLLGKCKAAEFEDGVRETEQLTGVYEKLRKFLAEKTTGKKNLSAERFLALAEDTYQEGLAVLQQALNIHEVLRKVDLKMLERERDEWLLEKEITSGDSKRLDRQIESHEKRIKMYQEQATELNNLIARSDALEAAMETALLTSTSIVSDSQSNLFKHDGAGTQLEQAVEAARRIEAKLSNLKTADEYATSEEDAIYLRDNVEKRLRAASAAENEDDENEDFFVIEDLDEDKE